MQPKKKIKNDQCIQLRYIIRSCTWYNLNILNPKFIRIYLIYCPKAVDKKKNRKKEAYF